MEGVQDVVQLGTSGSPVGPAVLFITDCQHEEEHEDDGDTGEAGAKGCPVELYDWAVGRLHDGLAVFNLVVVILTQPSRFRTICTRNLALARYS